MRTTLGQFFDSRIGSGGAADNFLYLRIIASSLVIYGHCFALAALGSGEQDFAIRFFNYRYSGDIAVAVFFVISGFLVTGSLERRGDLRGFALARAARLLPGLMACLVISALVVGPVLTTQPLAQYFRNGETWKYIAANALLYENRWFLPGVFESNRVVGVVNGSLWTLPVEARMYLGLLIFAVLTVKSRKGFAILFMLALLTLGSYKTWNTDTGAVAEPVRLALFFSAGVGMYLQRRWIPLNTWILAALCLLTWLLRNTVLYEITFSVALCYGIMWCAYVPKLPQLRWLGDISYGTYLYGWIVQQILIQAYPTLTPLKMLCFALPVTWLVATFSWRYVERPALDAAKAFQRKHWRRAAVPGPQEIPAV